MFTTGVIDRETLARVLAAEPRLPFAPEILSRDVIEALRREMEQPLYASGHGNAEMWEMHVKDLAALLGNGISPTQAGRMIRKLGLRSMRMRDGFHFFWNRAQLEILQEAVK